MDFFAGGSSLAHNSATLNDIIQRVRAAGSKSPVFARLAETLEALFCTGAPEDLLDAALLNSSVSRALLKTDDGSQTQEMTYAATPFVPEHIGYLAFKERLYHISGRRGGELAKEALESLFQSGHYDDPAYFDVYRTLQDRYKSSIAKTYLEKVILPALKQ